MSYNLIIVTLATSTSTLYFSGGLTVIDEGTHRGLCSTLSFMCTKCGKKSSMNISKSITSTGICYDVNRGAAYAMSEERKGRQALVDFCSTLGMPPPSYESSWALHNNAIYETSVELMHKECKDAGNRLRQQLRNDDPAITDTSLLDVTVSYDGTWHHQGFQSSHGVGVAMSVDTGEVLDTVVLSKICVTCEKNRSTKTGEEFQTWYVDQQSKTSTYDHENQRRKKLPPSFLQHMIPLYTRLSHPDLLRRCVLGLTQNQNESFNATIWKRCPKEKNFGVKSVNNAVASATLTWNVAANAKIIMLKALSLPVHPYTELATASKDAKRIYHARQKHSAYNEKRKTLKLLKANKEATSKRLFGEDYHPGQE